MVTRTLSRWLMSVALAASALVAINLLLTSTPAQARIQAAPVNQIRYVATTGSDVGNNCTNSGLPCATLQHAIDVANDGEEVLIATGTYTDVHTVDGHVQIASLTKTLTLRGGYTTTNWSTADPIAYPTTLDGQGQQRVLYATGRISSAFTGLRIINGSEMGNDGGGLYALNTNTIISDCDFIGNQVGSLGGAIYARGPISIKASRFVSNSSLRQGGAVYVGAAAIIANSRFESNRSGSTGAALFADSPELWMIETEMISNAVLPGGDGWGGAVSCTGIVHVSGGRFENNAGEGAYSGGLLAVTAYITDTRFISNSSVNAGGLRAVTVHMTGGRFERNSSIWQVGGALAGRYVYLSGTVIISNAALAGGGGLFAFAEDSAYGEAVLEHVRLEGNHALGDSFYIGDGGGIWAWGRLIISDSQILNNLAPRGGGVRIDSRLDSNSRIVNTVLAGNSSSIDGDAVAITQIGLSSLDLTHSTIASSTLSSRSAIAVYSGTVGITDTVIASHTIAISNTGGLVTEDYNLFFNNLTNTVGVASGGHSLIGDPKFVDPLHGNYHLQFGSAAIDRGVDAGVNTDLDGNPRPFGAGFDIGAYEYSATTHRIYLPVVLK